MKYYRFLSNLVTKETLRYSPILASLASFVTKLRSSGKITELIGGQQNYQWQSLRYLVLLTKTEKLFGENIEPWKKNVWNKELPKLNLSHIKDSTMADLDSQISQPFQRKTQSRTRMPSKNIIQEDIRPLKTNSMKDSGKTQAMKSKSQSG